MQKQGSGDATDLIPESFDSCGYGDQTDKVELTNFLVRPKICALLTTFTILIYLDFVKLYFLERTTLQSS